MIISLSTHEAYLQPEAVAVDLGDLSPPGDIMPRAFLGVLIVTRVLTAVDRVVRNGG